MPCPPCILLDNEILQKREINIARLAAQVSAPEYVDKLMEWIQSKLDNEQLFPPTTDVPFPRNFVLEVRNPPF